VNDQQADALQIGQIFEGKYKILRELGRGGFGMVYLAYQEPMDRYVALKVLRPGIGLSAPSAKERFLREVRIISKLRHPNTVTIHEFGETYDGGLYMTLEYVEGETLKDALKREGAFSVNRAAQLGMQIAKSLAEAHRLGIVHRDLKPANIMLTSIEGDKDFVKVLDFGVARLLDPKTTDLTSVGLPDGERELIGTPRYMSPEQVRGEGLSGTSDIYSLGLILYEMVAGEPAVRGDSTMALITQQISPEPLQIGNMKSVDPHLFDITRIAVDKRLSDRWQSAEQLAQALEQYLFESRTGRHSIGGGASGEFMQSYQSQLLQDPQQSGWQQQPPAGWSGQTPSGNWLQSGFYDPNMPPQSGQYPQQVRQTMPPQQYPPQQFPPQQNPYQTMPPQQNPYQTMPPQQNPYGTMPPQQNPYGTMPPQTVAPQPIPGSGHYPAQNRPGSGHYPNQQPGPFIEPPHSEQFDMPLQRNEAFEDFQATVEHQGLDRSMLRRAVSGDSFADLPPPPVDDRPFQEEPKPEVAPEVAKPKKKPVASPVAPQSDLLGFSFSLLKVILLSCIVLFISYIAFLVGGAALAPHTDEGLRLVAAVILAALPPFLAILTDDGGGDRFTVITPPLVRAVKVLATGAVFTVGLLLIISAVSASTVVGELRKTPNWFLSSNDTKLANLNRTISFTTADLVAGSMGAIGLYDARRGTPHTGAVGPTRTPGPTRQKSGATEAAPEGGETPETKSDTRPKTTPKSDPGYVNW